MILNDAVNAGMINIAKLLYNKINILLNFKSSKHKHT